MGIQIQKIETHWNYLLAIEGDLENLSRYVEFDKKNFRCFSVEIARILLASGAEVDVVWKLLCRKLNPASRAESINQYRNEIKGAYPNIYNFETVLPRYGLKLKSWSNWRKPDGVPLWWTAYNKVKHHRDLEYYRANLQNAMNSVAGLFVMLLHLYKEKAELGELVPNPNLLRVAESHFKGITHGGYELALFTDCNIAEKGSARTERSLR